MTENTTTTAHHKDLARTLARTRPDADVTSRAMALLRRANALGIPLAEVRAWARKHSGDAQLAAQTWRAWRAQARHLEAFERDERDAERVARLLLAHLLTAPKRTLTTLAYLGIVLVRQAPTSGAQVMLGSPRIAAETGIGPEPTKLRLQALREAGVLDARFRAGAAGAYRLKRVDLAAWTLTEPDGPLSAELTALLNDEPSLVSALMHPGLTHGHELLAGESAPRARSVPEGLLLAGDVRLVLCDMAGIAAPLETRALARARARLRAHGVTDAASLHVALDRIAARTNAYARRNAARQAATDSAIARRAEADAKAAMDTRAWAAVSGILRHLGQPPKGMAVATKVWAERAAAALRNAPAELWPALQRKLARALAFDGSRAESEAGRVAAHIVATAHNQASERKDAA